MRNRDRHQTDISRHNIAQAVAAHNLSPGHALCLTKQHIIPSGFLQKPVSDHVGVVPEMLQYHHRHRHDQMADTVCQIRFLPDAVSTTAWKDSPDHTEKQDKNQRQPEFRDAAGQSTNLAHHTIKYTVFFCCAEKSKKQCPCKSNNKSNSAKDHRISDSPPDHLRDRLPVFVGNTKISLQRILHPPKILRRNRIIQSQFFPGRFFFLHTHLLHTLSIIRLQRIGRSQTRNRKNKHRKHQQTA